jgi:hypothetical protein
LIGYCFKEDVWFRASGIEFDSSTKKWSSNRVENEFKKRFQYLVRSRREALLITIENIKRINQNPTLTLTTSEIVNCIPNSTTELQWLVTILNSLASSPINKEELLKGLKNTLEGFSRYCMPRYKTILSMMVDTRIECWPRYYRYPNIMSTFISSGMTNIDDNEIILDAHDLSINIPEHHIHLVTGDRRDIKNFESTIVANTKICSVVYLGSF